jgi:hypothetical protein
MMVGKWAELKAGRTVVLSVEMKVCRMVVLSAEMMAELKAAMMAAWKA